MSKKIISVLVVMNLSLFLFIAAAFADAIRRLPATDGSKSGILKEREYQQPAILPIGTKKQTTFKESPSKPTYVSSCFEEVPVDAKISEDFVRGYGVKPLNYNQVKLRVHSSMTKGDAFECYYGSQNSNLPNTIYNIVYSYPCKSAVKGGTSYAHSFTCECSNPPVGGQPSPCPAK